MADFESKLNLFNEEGVRIYGVSTDNAQDAAEMVEKNKITFPVLHGVDGPKTAEAWGSFYYAERDTLHATGFILWPNGTVASATYSTGPIGRISADDALRFIRTRKKRLQDAQSGA